MFPIREDYFFSKAINDRNLKILRCDNTQHEEVKATIGLLHDVSTAEIEAGFNYLRNTTDEVPTQTEKGYYLFNRKLVVIVSRNYMKFHGIEDTNGFTMSPWFAENRESFGSWNVAFVVDETLEDELAGVKNKSQGIVLHEIAHLLGQEKEYYGDRNSDTDDPLPDNEQEWFCNFPGKLIEPCYKHKIFRGFQANFNFQTSWKFLNDKFPFMNNETITIENMWIDRKTYQKIFRTLYQENLDPRESRTQEVIQESLSPVVTLSGVYDKKRGIFYENFSMAYEKGLPTISHQKGDIEISLVKIIREGNDIKNKVVSKANIPTNMKMELILNKGGGRTISLNKVPIVVSLPIPKKYFIDEKAKKNLRLRVRETFYRNVIINIYIK